MADLALIPRPIPSLLDDTARNYPNSPAIAFLGRRWTYRALDAEVMRATRGLQDIGVKPGTRVGLCLPNTPYSVIYFFAVLRAGGIVVNFNPLYVERELAHQIADSGTEVMVTIDLAIIYPKVAAVVERSGLRKIVVCSMQAALPLAKGLAFRLAKRADLARIPDDGISITAHALTRNAAPPDPVTIDPHATAVLQ